MLSVVLVPHILAHRTSITIQRHSGKVTGFSGIMNRVGLRCSQDYSFSSVSLYVVGSKINSFVTHQHLISPSQVDVVIIMQYAVTLAEAVRSISRSIWLYVFFWWTFFFKCQKQKPELK